MWIRTAAPQPVTLDFEQLTDVRGHPNRSDDFSGHYLLVAFGYTSCPDVCPLTLSAVHAALEDLGAGAAALVPVFITLDPKRDTPERLAVYTRAFDPRIRAFTGSAATIAAAAAAFHVEYEARPVADGSGYTVDHTALIFLVDPKRRIRAAIPETLPPRELAQRIIRAFNTARRS